MIVATNAPAGHGFPAWRAAILAAGATERDPPAWRAAILAAVATERYPPAWGAAILAAGGRRWNGDHTLGGGDRGAGRFGVLEIGRKLQKRLRISKSPYLQVAKAIQIYWGQTLAQRCKGHLTL